jgi:hypothetical protein
MVFTDFEIAPMGVSFDSEKRAERIASARTAHKLTMRLVDRNGFRWEPLIPINSPRARTPKLDQFDLGQGDQSFREMREI